MLLFLVVAVAAAGIDLISGRKEKQPPRYYVIYLSLTLGAMALYTLYSLFTHQFSLVGWIV